MRIVIFDVLVKNIQCFFNPYKRSNLRSGIKIDSGVNDNPIFCRVRIFTRASANHFALKDKFVPQY